MYKMSSEMNILPVNMDGNLTAVCVLEIHTLLELMNESLLLLIC